MADNPFKRYLDAGIAFTSLTQSKAQAIVEDLVNAGEVQTEQAQTAVAELLERSRQNTERLLDTIRNEVREQVVSLGLVGQAELARLEKRIEELTGYDTATAVRKVAGKKAAATREGRPTPRAATGAATATATKAAGSTKKAAKKATGTTKKAAKKATGTTKKAAKKATGTTKKAAKKATGTTKKAAKKAPAKKAPAKKATAAKKQA
ncbi:hypothetical protein HC251_10560 [Iamia sp. SCSIO 61187]|uniref:phasin family protein n=1 Tax=Iamia sp. SCSIO 61187 TaxID=2722752 RepID=UPI001C6393FE|nr:hypothetical protein [Iamia sp. SCSIO 61187]QYG92827.1 hypothetical protein HC251_10560 [Iamia sp. SCSIO 61187]